MSWIVKQVRQHARCNIKKHENVLTLAGSRVIHLKLLPSGDAMQSVKTYRRFGKACRHLD
jgi:hypothetical protein